MKQKDHNQFVLYRLEMSREALEAAKILIINKNWNSSINRLYYSAYYAISALLKSKDIEPKTHSGLKTQFFKHFVKTKIIDKELAKAYSDIIDWRHKGDYGDFYDFNQSDVNSISPSILKLIEQVKSNINIDEN